MIRIENLTKYYGKNCAVQNLSLNIEAGQFFGFLGPNGAGKTTTIKMLIGLLRPTEGVARIGGHDIQEEPLKAKALLGYVPDKPQLPEKLTAREYLEFIGGLYRLDPRAARQRGEEFLTLFDLADRADEMLGGYSHGMRQKTALTGALLHRPQAFFLDEPTVGLDPRGARQIKDILRNLTAQGTSVFMSTHILEIAEGMCDRVFIINQGQIIASGTLDELRAGGNASLEDIFLALTGGTDAAPLIEAIT